MDKFHGYVKSHAITAFLLSVGILCAGLSGVRMPGAQSASRSPAAQLEGAMLADFRRVEVASVSDALEELTGKRMYMTHRMHPIFTTKFAGFARTVQLKKDEGNTDPAALSGMLTAIDQGTTDSVYVMVVENGEDIAGIHLPVSPYGPAAIALRYHCKDLVQRKCRAANAQPEPDFRYRSN